MPKEATDGSEKAIQEKNKQTNKQEMMGEGEGGGQQRGRFLSMTIWLSGLLSLSLR